MRRAVGHARSQDLAGHQRPSPRNGPAGGRGDLAFTPATNTLPIRRLGLAVGDSRDVTAAWVRYPELDLVPLPQSYTRLAATGYRYQSRDGAFTAELETDELGLVVRYPPGWSRPG
jgi:hypothetical protein